MSQQAPTFRMHPHKGRLGVYRKGSHISCRSMVSMKHCLHQYIYKKKLDSPNQIAIPVPENHGTDTPNSSVCDKAGPLGLPATPSPQTTETSFPTPDTPETPSDVSTVQTQRIRVTAANDVYGRVEGAKRVNNVYGGLLRSVMHGISD
jgi:hypothetical protein